jgi:pimeloyl-ACP methyl ester carboxylesterase
VAQLFGKAPDPRFIEITRAMLMRQDVQLSLPLLHALTNDSYYDRLNEIRIETRILCGDLDRTCPPSHSRRLGAGLPNASSRWLPGIGHMLAYEVPDVVVEAVRET